MMTLIVETAITLAVAINKSNTKIENIMEVSEIIGVLRDNYTGEEYPLQLEASMYLGHETQLHLRKKVVEAITGRTTPASKCTLLYTASVLKTSFDQPQLF